MARRHRIRFCGAIYHVMSRGNRKQTDLRRRRRAKAVHQDSRDRSREVWRRVLCLLPDGQSLSSGPAHAARQHTECDAAHRWSLHQYVNWRHQTTGHLLEGRYTGIVLDDTDYLRNAIGYVLRNPVKAGLVADAGHWRWSSYKATIGQEPQRFLTLTWLTSLFVGTTLKESRDMLAKHVKNEPEEYADLVRAAAEGPHEFKKRVRGVIGATLYMAELPRSYRALARPPLSELFGPVRVPNDVEPFFALTWFTAIC